jgi:hypothetical protein
MQADPPFTVDRDFDAIMDNSQVMHNSVNTSRVVNELCTMQRLMRAFRPAVALGVVYAAADVMGADASHPHQRAAAAATPSTAASTLAISGSQASKAAPIPSIVKEAEKKIRATGGEFSQLSGDIRKDFEAFVYQLQDQICDVGYVLTFDDDAP